MADFYIDFTAAGGGTGTFASPWNRYTSITGVFPADVVWVRRVSYTETVANCNIGPSLPDNTPIVGWPLSGDSQYAARPVAARSAWDGDAALYAECLHTPGSVTNPNNLYRVTLGVDNVNKTLRLARLKFYRLSVAPSGGQSDAILGTLTYAASVPTLQYITENCHFEINGTGFAEDQFAGVCMFFTVAGATSAHTWVDTGSTLISRCGNAAIGVILHTQDQSSGQFQRLTVNWTNTYSLLIGTHPTAQWIYTAGASGYSWLRGYFDRCTFECGSISRTVELREPNIPSSTGLLAHRCTFKTKAGSIAGTARFKLWDWRFVDCIFSGFGSVEANLTSASISIDALTPGTVESGRGALHISAATAFIRAANLFFAPGALRDIYFLAPNDGRSGGVALLRTVSESGSGLSNGVNTIVSLADPVGSPGAQKCRTYAGLAQTLSASRIGGGRYAFFLTPSQGSAPAAQGIGTSEPGFDSVFVTLKPGANTVTVYGAHTGYATAPKTSDVWFEVEVPSDTGRTVVSSRTAPDSGAPLTADTSSWNGLIGIPTRFTVTVSVTAAVPVVATLRAFAGLAGGSVYFDPVAVVS